MKISIIIPNFNGKKLLEKNLPFIIKHSEGAEIIVVDDGSTDESASYVLKHFPSIEVIRKPKNDGFAVTVNTGVRAAKGEFIVLLNSDIIPRKHYLEPLLSHFSDSNVFGVGCMDESIEGDAVVPRGRGIGSFHRGFLMHTRGEIDRDDTLWVSGGSGMFRKSLWEKLGGMDELYSPFYWEDIDLSYRALKAGYKLVFEPKSIVEHRHSEGAIKKSFTKSAINQTAYRNQFFFVWKNITSGRFILQHVLWLPYHVLSAIFRGDRAFLKGLLYAVIKFPLVYKNRVQLKSLWTKNDEEIFQQFITG